MSHEGVDAPAKDLLPPEARDDMPARRITPVKVLLFVIVLGIIAMWVYALSPLAERPAPDAMLDTSVGPKAEAVCKETAAQLAALPKPEQTPQPDQRADVVAQSDQLLRTMLDRLALIPVGGAADDRQRDERVYSQWLADWRVYLNDREDYAKRLRADRDARIFVTQKGAKQITEPITGFAASNQMRSCQPPGDIF